MAQQQQLQSPTRPLMIPQKSPVHAALVSQLPPLQAYTGIPWNTKTSVNSTPLSLQHSNPDNHTIGHTWRPFRPPAPITQQLVVSCFSSTVAASAGSRSVTSLSPSSATPCSSCCAVHHHHRRQSNAYGELPSPGESSCDHRPALRGTTSDPHTDPMRVSLIRVNDLKTAREMEMQRQQQQQGQGATKPCNVAPTSSGFVFNHSPSLRHRHSGRKGKDHAKWSAKPKSRSCGQLTDLADATSSGETTHNFTSSLRKSAATLPLPPPSQLTSPQEVPHTELRLACDEQRSTSPQQVSSVNESGCSGDKKKQPANGARIGSTVANPEMERLQAEVDLLRRTVSRQRLLISKLVSAVVQDRLRLNEKPAAVLAACRVDDDDAAIVSQVPSRQCNKSSRISTKLKQREKEHSRKRLQTGVGSDRMSGKRARKKTKSLSVNVRTSVTAGAAPHKSCDGNNADSRIMSLSSAHIEKLKNDKGGKLKSSVKANNLLSLGGDFLRHDRRIGDGMRKNLDNGQAESNSSKNKKQYLKNMDKVIDKERNALHRIKQKNRCGENALIDCGRSKINERTVSKEATHVTLCEKTKVKRQTNKDHCSAKRDVFSDSESSNGWASKSGKNVSCCSMEDGVSPLKSEDQQRTHLDEAGFRRKAQNHASNRLSANGVDSEFLLEKFFNSSDDKTQRMVSEHPHATNIESVSNGNSCSWHPTENATGTCESSSSDSEATTIEEKYSSCHRKQRTRRKKVCVENLSNYQRSKSLKEVSPRRVSEKIEANKADYDHCVEIDDNASITSIYQDPLLEATLLDLQNENLVEEVVAENYLLTSRSPPLERGDLTDGDRKTYNADTCNICSISGHEKQQRGQLLEPFRPLNESHSTSVRRRRNERRRSFYGDLHHSPRSSTSRIDNLSSDAPCFIRAESTLEHSFDHPSSGDATYDSGSQLECWLRDREATSDAAVSQGQAITACHGVGDVSSSPIQTDREHIPRCNRQRTLSVITSSDDEAANDNDSSDCNDDELRQPRPVEWGLIQREAMKKAKQRIQAQLQGCRSPAGYSAGGKQTALVGKATDNQPIPSEKNDNKNTNSGSITTSSLASDKESELEFPPVPWEIAEKFNFSQDDCMPLALWIETQRRKSAATDQQQQFAMSS